MSTGSSVETSVSIGTGEVYALGPPWITAKRGRLGIDVEWLLAAAVMSVGGVVFFGWRGIMAVAVTTLAAVAGYMVTGWVKRRLWPGRPIDSVCHGVGLGWLLGLTLPVMGSLVVHAAAGLVLGLIGHVMGRACRIRCHPVGIVLLLAGLGAWYGAEHDPGQAWVAMAQPHQGVLRPNRLVMGDVRDVDRSAVAPIGFWHAQAKPTDSDAVSRPQPEAQIILLQKKILQQDEKKAAQMLTSLEQCSLGELVVGAVPGPIGASSRGLLVFGGLVLIHRRLSRWPILIMAVLGAVVTLGVMPVMYHDRWVLVYERLMAMGSIVSVLYLAYMLLASPLMLIVMVLSPMTAPMSIGGRAVYGWLLGSLVIACQWWIQIPAAAYLSLVVVGLLSRSLDAMCRCRLKGPCGPENTSSPGALPLSAVGTATNTRS